MAECILSVYDSALPIVVLSFAGSFLAILVTDCLKNKPTPILNQTIKIRNYDSSDEESGIDCEKSNDESDEESEKESEEKSDETLKQDDSELIAAVRESSVLSVVDADISPGSRQPSISSAGSEEMSKTLITLASTIASTLEGSTHIPNDRKQELVSLLQTVPDLVKASEAKNVEIRNSEESKNSEGPINRKTPPLDRKQQSEILMKTLDELQGQ